MCVCSVPSTVQLGESGQELACWSRVWIVFEGPLHDLPGASRVARCAQASAQIQGELGELRVSGERVVPESRGPRQHAVTNVEYA
jgi:hypothetical protein